MTGQEEEVGSWNRNSALTAFARTDEILSKHRSFIVLISLLYVSSLIFSLIQSQEVVMITCNDGDDVHDDREVDDVHDDMHGDLDDSSMGAEEQEDKGNKTNSHSTSSGMEWMREATS